MTDHVHSWRLATPKERAFLCTFNLECPGHALLMPTCLISDVETREYCGEALCSRHAAEGLDIPPSDSDERFAWGLDRQSERGDNREIESAAIHGARWETQISDENLRHQSEVRGFHLASKAGSW